MLARRESRDRVAIGDSLNQVVNPNVAGAGRYRSSGLPQL